MISIMPGEESSFAFDIHDAARKGHDFKDYICPDSIVNKTDHLMIGDRYARILYLKDYANYIKDSFVAELTELSRNHDAFR